MLLVAKEVQGLLHKIAKDNELTQPKKVKKYKNET